MSRKIDVVGQWLRPSAAGRQLPPDAPAIGRRSRSSMCVVDRRALGERGNSHDDARPETAVHRRACSTATMYHGAECKRPAATRHFPSTRPRSDARHFPNQCRASEEIRSGRIRLRKPDQDKFTRPSPALRIVCKGGTAPAANVKANIPGSTRKLISKRRSISPRILGSCIELPAYVGFARVDTVRR